MINTLEIKNFQSHIDSIIDFDKGFNVITGASDAGKSAIIRSLLWVITNRPQGDSFKNWNSDKPVHVGIDFDDNWIVKERKNGKNVYEIEDKKLEAVRSDVPEEIQSITRITDFNIQTQHGQYFLLQDSPGEVARKLNELVGLDVIDRIYKNLNSRIIESKGRLKIGNERIEGLNEKIENLSYLAHTATIIKKIESDMTSLTEMQNRLVSVKILSLKITEINSKIENHKKILKIEPEIKLLQKKIKLVEELTIKENVLCSLVNEYKENIDRYTSEKEWLEVSPKYKSLKLKISEFEKLDEKKFSAEKTIRAYKTLDKASETNKNTLYELKDSYIRIIEENKICPTCRRPITFVTLESIKDSLK
jgi:DNA repair protein SbcC/Rad50